MLARSRRHVGQAVAEEDVIAGRERLRLNALVQRTGLRTLMHTDRAEIDTEYRLQPGADRRWERAAAARDEYELSRLDRRFHLRLYEEANLPLLAPMSEVAGRLAIQAGATSLQKANGGRGILLKVAEKYHQEQYDVVAAA